MKRILIVLISVLQLSDISADNVEMIAAVLIQVRTVVVLADGTTRL